MGIEHILKDWKEVIDVDFPEIGPITEKTREITLKYNGSCDSVRIATGRFYTNEEFEAYKKEVLSRPLP